MAKPVVIKFGAWEPDKSPHMSPALVEAINVLPVGGAYAPFPAHAPISGAALPSTAYGFFAAPLSNGDPAVYAATRSQVYRVRNGSISLAYDAGNISAAPWWFAIMGGRVITGNLGLSPVAGEPGDVFTPLGGSPPAARVGAVVERNFLVLGNIQNDGIDGLVPNRVRWSGFNNPDTWGTNVGTQADFEDMADEGGPVVAITGKATGTVFQRRAITRMQYAGGSVVFNFTTVETGRGAISTGAVCDIGTLTFFIADDGFFAWDGVQAVPIGTDRVDRWFYSNIEHTRTDRISSAFDPVSRCVMWAFPESGQQYNSRIIVYSLADQKWTTIALPMQQLATSATFSATLEQMPTPDLSPISWDDPVYGGKQPVLAGLSSTNVYGTFTGANLASILTTADFQSAPGQRSFVKAARPLVDATTAKVAVGFRNQLGSDAVVWNPATAMGVDGLCPQRTDGRYLRYSQTTTAGDTWSRSVGLEVELQGTGRR